ncbi:MAG: YbhB/YbcL family Raf kinase inhibitor-like protein [Candidatus Limnocylindria bacterium]
MSATDLIVTSTAFGEGDPIPTPFTCDGDDRSPPLAWSNSPDGTQAFALIVHDPDARGFVHWLVADVPRDVTSLPENASVDGVEGRTGFGASAYGGPCPPSGTHRYAITLYALSSPTGLAPGFGVDELREAVASTTLGEATLTATYTRGGS